MIGLVWAQSANGVIGRDGRLPWRLPEDMAHFRELTRGSTVIMGRRTWESLSARYRPLPGRYNVVLSTATDWTAEGATVAGSLPEALEQATGDVWVIGGASVYAVALPLADRLEITELADEVVGDVQAPAVDERWCRVRIDPETDWHVSSDGLRYRFCSYQPEDTVGAESSAEAGPEIGSGHVAAAEALEAAAETLEAAAEKLGLGGDQLDADPAPPTAATAED